MKIHIEQGWDHYFAWIEGGGPGALGSTPDDALGALVRVYLSRFNVTSIDVQPRLPLDLEETERSPV